MRKISKWLDRNHPWINMFNIAICLESLYRVGFSVWPIIIITILSLGTTLEYLFRYDEKNM